MKTIRSLPSNLRPLGLVLCGLLLSAYSQESETFHENGQLEQRANFKDGKREGLWEEFDEDGNLTETRTYRNGVLIETNDNP